MKSLMSRAEALLSTSGSYLVTNDTLFSFQTEEMRISLLIPVSSFEGILVAAFCPVSRFPSRVFRVAV